MSHSSFGWYCIDHREFFEDHDAINEHIDTLPTILPHTIVGCASMLDGESFPPDGEAPSP